MWICTARQYDVQIFSQLLGLLQSEILWRPSMQPTLSIPFWPEVLGDAVQTFRSCRSYGMLSLPWEVFGWLAPAFGGSRVQVQFWLIYFSSPFCPLYIHYIINANFNDIWYHVQNRENGAQAMETLLLPNKSVHVWIIALLFGIKCNGWHWMALQYITQ